MKNLSKTTKNLSDGQNSTDALTLQKGISAHEIIECIEVKGMSITQAAKHLGCTKQNISDRLKVLGITPGGLKRYKENRADLLAYYQLQLIKSLTPEKIKDASLSQTATTFGIMYDKERLERGQSTNNLAIADFTKSVDRMAEALKAEIKARQLPKQLEYDTE